MAARDPSGGLATPTRILPSDTAGSYSFGFQFGRPAVTSSVITVARMPPSIVSSNMMIRFGHQSMAVVCHSCALKQR